MERLCCGRVGRRGCMPSSEELESALMLALSSTSNSLIGSGIGVLACWEGRGRGRAWPDALGAVRSVSSLGRRECVLTFSGHGAMIGFLVRHGSSSWGRSGALATAAAFAQRHSSCWTFHVCCPARIPPGESRSLDVCDGRRWNSFTVRQGTVPSTKSLGRVPQRTSSWKIRRGVRGWLGTVPNLPKLPTTAIVIRYLTGLGDSSLIR